ncbi:MAG TPA: glycoside hydrolase family 16 protein [Jatrophihabitans sp.]|jgi:beta-glucanase (GH16 family)|uniref:glycoside hydrolase family 16 protein n=1 Tax=Jatrophihabitans sp. TaxID=1932789 RepID=UPI002EFF5B87
MSRHHGARPTIIKRSWVGATLVALVGAGAMTALNVSSTTTAAAAATVNLVADPTLSKGTASWFTRSGGSLAVVPGHNGHPAIRLRNETAAPLTLALNDRVNTVRATVAGATYQAGAWIRTDAPGVTAAARQMEYQRLVYRGANRSSAWLRTTGWVHVSVNYTAKANLSTIDFNVLAWALPRGKSLLISEPTLTLVSLPSQPDPVVKPPKPSTSSPKPTTSAPTTSAPAPTTSAPAPSTSTPPPAPSTSTPPPAPSTSTPRPAPSTSTPAPAPTTSAPAPSGYKLVFNEDFNSIDRTKWNVRNNSWARNEESIVTSRADNVFVSNGALTLRAIKESYTVGSTTRQYTSGYLDTIGRGSWQYGRFEMRAKLPTAQGMWPAFWLRNNNTLGELDIMEAVGGKVNQTVQTIHQSTNGDMAKAGHEDTLPSGTTATWHTYSVDRQPGSVKWYVDGRLVFSKTQSLLTWLDPAFNEPMNIRLNLQVGGSMPNWYGLPVVGAPLGASDFVIDYVRVYQLS